MLSIWPLLRRIDLLKPAAICLLLVGCTTLPKDFSRTESYAYPHSARTMISVQARQEIDAHAGQSGYYLLNNGLDAFVARAVLAERAMHSIDAQYYLFHSDLTGALFVNQLLKAAERGVRVRLLVDDMAAEGRDQMAAILDSHPNVEVRIFNPFSRQSPRAAQYVTGFGKLTRRMHNKTYTVDNQVSIVGGRNIGDEYFDAAHELVFSDLDAMILGPLVPEISRSFDLYWNHELAYPISVLNRQPVTAVLITQAREKLADFVLEQAGSDYIKALRGSVLAQHIRAKNVPVHWGEAEVVYDHPEKILDDKSREKYRLSPQLRPYFAAVKDELVIISPYFVPGKPGTALLEELKRKGVRVRILTNSLAATDVAIVHAGYMRYRKRLLRAGIEIHEANKESRATLRHSSGLRGASKASLHTKSFIFDRKHVFIGSLNVDPRSISENTEIGLVMESTEVAREMIDWFERFTKEESFALSLVQDARGYDHLRWQGRSAAGSRVWRKEPHTSFWLRAGVGLMRILPIESQL